MRSGRKLLSFIAILLVSAVLGGCAAAPERQATSENTSASINVSAASEVKVVPDRARVVVGVRVRAQSANEAEAQGGEAANQLIDALKAYGIAPESIQSAYTELFPVYGEDTSDSPADDTGFAGIADSTEVIVAYEMRSFIEVSDILVEQIGDVLRVSVDAGASDFDGISYYSSSYDEAYQEALKQAVAAAQEKALVLAEAAGVQLGGIISITEGYQNTSIRYEAAEAELADSVDTLNVEPGTLDVRANIDVSFEIQS